MAEEALTALGNARIRFLEGLPGRAQELHELTVRCRPGEGESEALGLVHRHLQTLAASARLFEESGLAQFAERALSLWGGDAPTARSPDLPRLLAVVDEIAGFIGEARSSGSLSPVAVSQAAPSRRKLPDRPVEVPHTVSGLLPAPRPNPVLVVGDDQVIEQIRTVLPDGRFEVSGSALPEQALRLMHITAPSVVLVDARLAEDSGLDLVRRIRRDPLCDVRHVLLLGERLSAEAVARLGCDGSVLRPIDGAALISMLADLLDTTQSGGGLRFLTEGTVDDIADRVAAEIRNGLVHSLQAGRDERIALDDTHELMAAAWSAIGRIRTHLAQRSEGRLRFQEPSPPRRGEAPVGHVGAATPGAPGTLANSPHASIIAGRRVLVADDDPAVLWFFTGLLREVGATALEAKDGHEALAIARARRPHAIISDILMPKLDGFALCRALKRDVILADVPVILLSWKEDFLHRMRELNAGASGYLRKEASSREILASVAEVLQPRARLEAQLDAGREVHGRVERTGIVPILETAIVRRPNARISVVDAWNLFEVTLSEGHGIGVTRTSTDGSFARGERALQQLLGTRSGRFTVGGGVLEPRAGLTGPVDRVLQEAARKLGAMLDAVSDRRLLRIRRVELDESSLPALLAATPAPLAEVVERLRKQDGDVRAWLLGGEIAPQVLQDQLGELARRGVIVGVWDADGGDLVAEALAERAATPATLVHLSLLPPPRPAPERPEQADGLPVGVAGAPSEQLPAVQNVDPGSAQDTHGEIYGEAAALDPAAVQAALLPPAVPEELGADRDSAPPAVPPAAGLADAPAPPVAGAWDEEGLGSRAIVFLTVIVLGFAGYFAFRALGPLLLQDGNPGSPAATVGEQVQAAAGRPEAPKAVAAAGPEPAAEAAEGAETTEFGRVLPFVDRSRGVQVKVGEGLLVVESGGSTSPTDIRVAGRSLGQAPIAVALPAGRHELVFRQDDRSRFRYLVIRSGETRIVDVPAR